MEVLRGGVWSLLCPKRLIFPNYLLLVNNQVTGKRGDAIFNYFLLNTGIKVL